MAVNTFVIISLAFLNLSLQQCALKCFGFKRIDSDSRNDGTQYTLFKVIIKLLFIPERFSVQDEMNACLASVPV